MVEKIAEQNNVHEHSLSMNIVLYYFKHSPSIYTWIFTDGFCNFNVFQKGLVAKCQNDTSVTKMGKSFL